jgi:signal transduction histidine kinase/CheY-like chemotaxis protein
MAIVGSQTETQEASTHAIRSGLPVSEVAPVDDRSADGSELIRVATGGAARYELREISRARAVIWINLACVAAWVVINGAAGWWLHNGRPVGVAGAGVAMAVTWIWALRDISRGRMARGVATYTLSGLLLLLAMGLFVPELSLLFTFATFIFLAFGLSYMSGRASMQVVALTIGVALILLVTSIALRWTSGVPDQLYRWVNLTGMLMALSIDGTMFIMLRRTLEARAGRVIDAERATAEMKERLAQQERLESLGQLAGGIAHDFNNLLGVILNFALFAKEKVLASADLGQTDGNVNPEELRSAAKDIDRVVGASESASRLTHQLLAFARREVLRPEPLEVNSVVREMEPLLRRAVGEHIEFSTSLSPEPWRALVDRGQLEQVLTNLAINARDAMPNGGQLVIQTDNVDADEPYGAGRQGFKPGRYVRVRVSDTGTGMDEHTLQHVFEPFFTTKERGRGTGLGLATVHGIIKQSGGFISIYSELGLGTRVSAMLPATERRHSEVAVAPKRLEHARSGTILVVEDAADLRELTERILTRNGYRVITASDGLMAIEAAHSYDGKIDLLLTDVVMPKMHGKDLADVIVSTRPDTRVLFMSGYAEPMLGKSGILDPGILLIEKPFTAETLLTRVSDAFEANTTTAAGSAPPPIM